MSHQGLDDISESRRKLLRAVKACGRAPITMLAQALSVTRQAVRQQLAAAERDGLVVAVPQSSTGTAGRPAMRYQLSRSGEALFPKRYDQLAVLMIDTVAQIQGPQALREVLAGVTQKRVAA